MDKVFSHLSIDIPNAHFHRVEAEEQPEIYEEYSVSAVPFFVFFKDGMIFDKLEGADPSSLANKVAKVTGFINPREVDAPASLGMALAPPSLRRSKIWRRVEEVVARCVLTIRKDTGCVSIEDTETQRSSLGYFRGC
ncbi:monothiol glutaredoxin-S17-like [Hibiscus syriacus]|uniref:monothiol glutaredoxin-S17-like n=1 Tax=Hibiscus syriacus TaxID=106335 RepID=UPI0019225615|nr:monothiol glutaredoxin-S17-like [Hibiscus syriacus]